MRLPLIAAFCLAGFPALAQVTAPLGSQERTDQIIQEARNLSRNMLAGLAETAEKDAIREPVVARLSEACGNMYRRDPDATITNQLCFDVFWERGLPD